jgi:MarR family 2-MHQ and catechol resistance regulon transcriptional repressor
LTNTFETVIISTSKHLIWNNKMPTHFQGDPKAKLALDTFIKFTRAATAFENRLYQSNVIGDLTPTQFGVLETLYHLGSMCQGEISSKQLKSTGNMTLVLDNLEKRGLVRRERESEDRRMVTIHLMPEGTALIEKIFPRMVAAIQDEFEILTPEEQQDLGRICRTLGKKSRL